MKTVAGGNAKPGGVCALSSMGGVGLFVMPISKMRVGPPIAKLDPLGSKQPDTPPLADDKVNVGSDESRRVRANGLHPAKRQETLQSTIRT